MKRRLGFSTLGCPELTIDEALDLAESTGWRSIELRSGPQGHVGVSLPSVERARIRGRLERLDPLALSTYIRIGEARLSDAEVVASVRAEAALAEDLGVPRLRVFAGSDEDALISRRARACLAETTVTLLLETHDSHPTGAAVARVADRVDDPRFGIIWDVAHPWVAGETVAVTAAAVWPRLHHVQLKDESGTALREPRLLGAGAVPLDRVLAELDDRGYRGALCLEWERAWYPDLPPLAEALVAAQRRLGRHPQSSPSGTPA